MLRENGAKQVHIGIASPMVVNTCHWGVDIPTKEELICATKTVEEIKESLNADSLNFITLPNLLTSLGEKGENYCFHCFIKD
jgi:amidophosphoribosyltransferase